MVSTSQIYSLNLNAVFMILWAYYSFSPCKNNKTCFKSWHKREEKKEKTQFFLFFPSARRFAVGRSLSLFIFRGTLPGCIGRCVMLSGGACWRMYPRLHSGDAFSVILLCVLCASVVMRKKREGRLHLNIKNMQAYFVLSSVCTIFAKIFRIIRWRNRSNNIFYQISTLQKIWKSWPRTSCHNSARSCDTSL